MAILKVKAKTVKRGPDKTAAVKKAIEQAHGSYVSVGWESDKKYPDGGPLVGQVALWNELGTYSKNHKPHTPARPFMRPAIDENRAAIDAIREEAIRNTITAQWTAEKGLGEIGRAVSDFIKQKIKSNVPPPLAASTRRRKESEGKDPVTLIDTGLMLETLSYKVHLTEKMKKRDSDIVKAQMEKAQTQARRKELRDKLRKEGKAAREQAKAVRKATKEQRKAIMKKLREGKKVGKKRRAKIRKAVKAFKQRAVKRANKAIKGIEKAAKRIKKSATKGKPKKPKGVEP